MAMPLSRTHLAILISLIGTGSFACRAANAQDASAYRTASFAESSETSIRAALGLAPASAASQVSDDSNETRVRRTLAIQPPPSEAGTKLSRTSRPVGSHSKPTAASVHAPSHPTPLRSDERPTIDEPPQDPLVEIASGMPLLEQTVLADRAQPSQLASPLPDVDAMDGGAAALLSPTGSAPRPRRRGDHPPNKAIADAPSSSSRRSTLWTSTTLALPPDRVRTKHGRPGVGSHERSSPSRLQARAKHAGSALTDPLFSLLQVLDGRGPDAAYRALLDRIASVSADATEARIASDVFDRIAGEVERLAWPTIVPADAEPPVMDIVDTIAASEAALPEPAIVVTGRFLPMHLLDVLDDDVIDPAGALPVQALLVRPPAPTPDARPIHALLPLQTIVDDSRSAPAPIAALRSFFDDRSAMKIAETAEVASRTPRPKTAVAPAETAEWMAFETLDFPPLFDEPSAFAKLQVERDPLSAAKPSRPLEARLSVSFDIFDPKLDVPTADLHDRPVASIQPAPLLAPVEFEIPLVRGTNDLSTNTGRDAPRPDPLLGMLALADSKLDDLRGGFETDNGLRISFGIERAVYVNGSLVTTTSLNVADLSRLTAGQAQSMGIDRATFGVIQSGVNNTFTPTQLSSGNVGTVIQNTLNDQKIQGITQINATVNSLDMIRRSDVQSRIQSALTDSIRR